MSRLEDRVALELLARHIPAPEREYRFAAILTGGTGAGVVTARAWRLL